MSENTEEVLEATQEATEQTTEKSAPMSYDDGVIKVNLNELNKPQEDAVSKQETNAGDDTVGQPENTQGGEDVVKEVREPIQEELQSVQNEESVIEEITDVLEKKVTMLVRTDDGKLEQTPFEPENEEDDEDGDS